jgi:hypothetical protein
MIVRGPAQANRFLLEGGLAASLSPDCELTLRRQKPADLAGRLRVARVIDLTRAEAEVIEGSPEAFARGSVVELSRWVVPPSEALRVLLPASGPPRAQLEQLARSLESLRADKRIEWVDDPSEKTPTHVLSWEAKSGWTLGSEVLGKELKTDRLFASETGPVRLYVQLPPPAELLEQLRFGPGSANPSIQPVESVAAGPHYLLSGRWRANSLEYAWILPGASVEVAGMSSLPVRSAWEPAAGSDAARKLETYALRIQKIRSWLQLASPPSASFPYGLALRNTRTGTLKDAGPLIAGEEYRLALRAQGELDALEPRYVYVFSIDSTGRTTRLYPRASTGTDGNLLPRLAEGATAPGLIELGERNDTFEISEPFGVDTYILLTSDRPLPDPGVLESEGVDPPVLRRGQDDPLQSLLAGVGSARTRGPALTPSKWSVVKIPFQSTAKPR